MLDLSLHIEQASNTFIDSIVKHM